MCLRHNVGQGGDADEVILKLWTAVVDVGDVKRIDFDECTTYGCTPEELVGDNYAPTQLLADEVRGSGASAVEVPSAALPGTHNLILFGVRVLHSFLSQPFAPDEEIPTGHLTNGARVPAEVASRVRWFGSEHSAVERWKATGSYDLYEDPFATRW
jgi:hypothetical protein